MRPRYMIVIAAVAVAGCEPSAPTAPSSTLVRATQGRQSLEDWYPTREDGSPDMNASAAHYGEAVTSDATGNSGSITAGYYYAGSRGEISIAAAFRFNADGEEVDGKSQVFGATGGTFQPVSLGWFKPFPVAAICNKKVLGVADFRSWLWNPLNQVTWGEKYSSRAVPTASTGPSCQAPDYMLSPSGTIQISVGESVTFSVSAVAAGSGNISGYEWFVDGDGAGAGTSVEHTFGSVGVFTVLVRISNTAGMSTTKYVYVEVRDPNADNCDDQTTEEVEDCTQNPPPNPVNGPSTAVGGRDDELHEDDGATQIWRCWYIDRFSRYGEFLTRTWLYCERLS